MAEDLQDDVRDEVDQGYDAVTRANAETLDTRSGALSVSVETTYDTGVQSGNASDG